MLARKSNTTAFYGLQVGGARRECPHGRYEEWAPPRFEDCSARVEPVAVAPPGPAAPALPPPAALRADADAARGQAAQEAPPLSPDPPKRVIAGRSTGPSGRVAVGSGGLVARPRPL